MGTHSFSRGILVEDLDFWFSIILCDCIENGCTFTVFKDVWNSGLHRLLWIGFLAFDHRYGEECRSVGVTWERGRIPIGLQLFHRFLFLLGSLLYLVEDVYGRVNSLIHKILSKSENTFLCLFKISLNKCKIICDRLYGNSIVQNTRFI